MLVDIFPLLAFGGAYYLYDFYVATAALIVTMTLLVGYRWLRRGQVENILWISYLLVLIFGSLTLALQDKTFLQWKPTIFAWLLAVALIGSQLFSKRSLLERAVVGFNPDFSLPPHVWQWLNLGWALGFLVKGSLNFYFAFYHSESTWVLFKLFGQFALTALYLILTFVYLRQYLVLPDTNQKHSGQ